MFSGLTSQVSSWMGKKEDGSEDPASAAADPNLAGGAGDGTEATDPLAAGSATGGADSVGPGSLTGTPTEDKDGQQPFGAVSTKALAGAKSLGGFLYSAVNKAGKSVAEAGAKIKKTVEENRLIADLNKEQEAFIASKGGEKGEAQAPWVGSPNEEALKEEILALSTDRRNFVRAPPPGVDFPWDFEAVEPVAQATLALDPNLETMRFELVPKVISEENFWRNYFYRVSLLRQSHEINAMASQQSTESNPTLASNDSVDNAQVRASGSEVLSKETNSTNGNDVRDATTAQQEITDSVKKLDIQSNKEEDWERELEAELKDYEVVPGQEAAKSDWDDGQIDDMLKDEEDLK
ncbi:synapse-associated protein of 47 kDa isoform X4 [Trichogramma pretiosum]|uniref:synapse-associated protein of 47 kDa isoform X4 n=1 Tax=Trichogramma pretiosum TaxID=7493 RepID=UPI000C71BE3F|nr:synapse-associated protein of 47 kDa isoform X4 [Trichogramma pretiosum]